MLKIPSEIDNSQSTVQLSAMRRKMIHSSETQRKAIVSAVPVQSAAPVLLARHQPLHDPMAVSSLCLAGSPATMTVGLGRGFRATPHILGPGTDIPTGQTDMEGGG